MCVDWFKRSIFGRFDVVAVDKVVSGDQVWLD